MMDVRDTATLRRQTRAWRMAGESVVLVPTMGNLHDGHLALVEAARDHGERVAVSIFVNPTQFVTGEDYDDYPRTLDSDLDKLESLDVDMVYCPDVTDIYPDGHDAATEVSVPALDGIFCGASRPGHFTGVATVVTRLFNLVQPDSAVFGEKDFQQLLLIRKLVHDLHFPIEVIGYPTVREADGLALSSRNQYLTAEERQAAPAIYTALCSVRDAIEGGERDFPALAARGRQEIEAAGLQVDYFSIVSAADLSEPRGSELVILAAAWLGRARLIDNLRVSG